MGDGVAEVWKTLRKVFEATDLGTWVIAAFAVCSFLSAFLFYRWTKAQRNPRPVLIWAAIYYSSKENGGELSITLNVSNSGDVSIYYRGCVLKGRSLTKTKSLPKGYVVGYGKSYEEQLARDVIPPRDFRVLKHKCDIGRENWENVRKKKEIRVKITLEYLCGSKRRCRRISFHRQKARLSPSDARTRDVA